MKPCQKFRKQIALLAMASLEAPQEPELRAHIEVCADCQKYFIETRSVAEKLREAEPEPLARASASFHRRMIAAVAKTERRSGVEIFLAEFVSRWNWRMALPAVSLVAVAIAAWLMSPQHPEIHNSSPIVKAPTAPPEVESDLSPTVSNYELVARQSLDKLDELLTDQGSRNFSPTPPLTAGQLSRMTIVN